RHGDGDLPGLLSAAGDGGICADLAGAHRRRRCPTRHADAGSADAAVSQQLGDQYAGEICLARTPIAGYAGGAEGQPALSLAREVLEEFPTPVARAASGD